MSNSDLNPYAPPTQSIVGHSWWTRLKAAFSFGILRRTSFGRGFPINYYGVVFFMDPENDAELYADVPAADHSPARVNSLAAEAVRLIPFLVRDHSTIGSKISGRSLTVRMIQSYEDAQSEAIATVTLNDAIDSAMLLVPKIGEAHPSELTIG